MYKVYKAMSWIMMPPISAIFLLSEIGVFNSSALVQPSVPKVHCCSWGNNTAHCTGLAQDVPVGGYML